jgi:uncharacterized protein YndB with AHSA1/START domain
MAATSLRSLHLERVLPARRVLVFHMHCDPDELARWWGPTGFCAPAVELDARVGGRYRITMQPPTGSPFHVTGKILEYDPPARLAYTFRYEEPDPDDRETVVTIALTDDCAATTLVLDQGEFATEARLALHEQGWSETLDRLDVLLRSRARMR